MNTDNPLDQRTAVEISVLEKFGLRWAVLSAWCEELAHRGLVVGMRRPLEDARLKLATGVFSACEVGCDLGRIEATLTAADSSSTPDSTAYWVDLLGRAMAENMDTEALLGNPAVKFLYLNCGFLPCKCGD
jgi:hypothetical protein